jgi:hypothetical protein
MPRQLEEIEPYVLAPGEHDYEQDLVDALWEAQDYYYAAYPERRAIDEAAMRATEQQAA